MYQSVTITDSFKLYPREHSEEPDIRISNMKDTRKVAGGSRRYKKLGALRQRQEQELQIKEMKALKQDFKIIEKVAGMKRIFDLDKKIDETQEYMEYQEGVMEYIEDINLKKSADEKLSKEEASHDKAGHLSTDMYEKVKEELSKYENSIEERKQSFVENAHKYDGKLEKMFIEVFIIC